ncbi:MAG: flagellar motor switch protein FliN [Terracidiphilus sp.]|nr:flagellar motor switch protein FliN [Terracidiphilus sp.]
MKTYIDCWSSVATALFSQALAGEPELAESLPKPLAAGSFAFAATLSGDQEGRFSVVLDGAILESPLMGEGVDQKAAWGELLREVADAAAGELLATSGQTCRVDKFEETSGESQVSRAFQLRSGERSWTILIRDEVHTPRPVVQAEKGSSAVSEPEPPGPSNTGATPSPEAALSPGIELLLDVELEASLRFGCRELPLGEILDLGPGDVVQLDRHVTDPVDLIVGDKIVARGEVVLVNGNFGLRITEVAAPRKRLETIRCLF